LHQTLVSKLDHETYTFEVHQHLMKRMPAPSPCTGPRACVGACRCSIAAPLSRCPYRQNI
jgi:hypothetical protein